MTCVPVKTAGGPTPVPSEHSSRSHFDGIQGLHATLQENSAPRDHSEVKRLVR